MIDGTIRWPELLEQLLGGEDLTEDRAHELMGALMEGLGEPEQVAALLMALRAKGEAATEIAGFVRAMVDAAAPIELAPSLRGRLVDTCGTGGDGAGTFNISTVAALVVAAAGVPVAKHGNRAASSPCGSADLLEAWGVRIELDGAAVARCIEELGIGFLFARTFHPAMRHVAPVRAALGVRTVFNLLGPLSNPAQAPAQVVGVADEARAPTMAAALARLGKRAMVVRGADGLDELSTTGTNRVWEVRDGTVVEGIIDPAELGFARATMDDLRGGDVAANVAIADAILAGEVGPRGDVVVLNAAASLVIADAVPDLASGVTRAREVLVSGAAVDLRDRWVTRTQELAAGTGRGNPHD